MDEHERTIIVKRIKKVHKGGHGGSWKIAYADFVTAMMALFLLLWLISTVPDEKKYELAVFMENYSLLKPAGESLIEDGKLRYGKSAVKGGEGISTGYKETRREALNRIGQEMKIKLGDLRDHIIIKTIDNEFRIHIVDKEGAPMFPSGGTEPNDTAKKILKTMSQSLANTGFMIAVEGHTDAHPFKSGNITNWELSTLRATAARRELEAFGLEANRFNRVTGYAANEPLFPDDPFNPQNRRISLLLSEK